MAQPSRPPKPSAEGFTRWPWWRRWFGLRSERAAARFLRRLGYRILGRNLADQRGEIDILALGLDRKSLVIIEVRSTESTDLDRVALSVNAAKQRKLTNATLRFLHRRRLTDVPVRFDILVISWPSTQREPTIRHFPNAFEATGRFQMHS
ncbi:MAG: YraN family protein [Planctomycetes bacterium]|nr:YraN family protein [Planctomycetota bacterium]